MHIYTCMEQMGVFRKYEGYTNKPIMGIG